MQRRIEFTATGSSALVGNFSAGDVWRGPKDHCDHLVEVHGCAKWADLAEAVVVELATKQSEQPADVAIAQDVQQIAAAPTADAAEKLVTELTSEQPEAGANEVAVEETEQATAEPTQDMTDKSVSSKKKGGR